MARIDRRSRASRSAAIIVSGAAAPSHRPRCSDSSPALIVPEPAHVARCGPQIGRGSCSRWQDSGVGDARDLGSRARRSSPRRRCSRARRGARAGAAARRPYGSAVDHSAYESGSMPRALRQRVDQHRECVVEHWRTSASRAGGDMSVRGTARSPTCTRPACPKLVMDVELVERRRAGTSPTGSAVEAQHAGRRHGGSIRRRGEEVLAIAARSDARA